MIVSALVAIAFVVVVAIRAGGGSFMVVYGVISLVFAAFVFASARRWARRRFDAPSGQ
jgi:uncharacterized membrane protein YidH (DUF202 family)